LLALLVDAFTNSGVQQRFQGFFGLFICEYLAAKGGSIKFAVSCEDARPEQFGYFFKVNGARNNQFARD